MPEFIPGRELSRAFYAEVVGPLVGDVEHSAALLGWGSDPRTVSGAGSSAASGGASLRGLPRAGSIDQLVDSTDVLTVAAVARRLTGFYGSTT